MEKRPKYNDHEVQGGPMVSRPPRGPYAASQASEVTSPGSDGKESASSGAPGGGDNGGGCERLGRAD